MRKYKRQTRVKSNYFCECGCGEVTFVSDRTNVNMGWKKGTPMRFLTGHNGVLHGATRGRRGGGQAGPEYNAYMSAFARCTNPNNPEYFRYGARGVKFLFKSYEEFFEHIGSRPNGLTLDRTDPYGNYEKGNVRWATPLVQANNRRCVIEKRGRNAQAM